MNLSAIVQNLEENQAGATLLGIAKALRMRFLKNSKMTKEIMKLTQNFHNLL